MIPTMQREVGDGKDGRPKGDCFRACVASIFELAPDDVPHFTANESRWFSNFVEWLRQFGLTVENATHEPAWRPPYWPAGWWIASVKSENFDGETHAVVMRGTFTPDGGDDWTAVAHDPSPKPRRTPYVFVGRYAFAALDPAQIARAFKQPTPATARRVMCGRCAMPARHLVVGDGEGLCATCAARDAP